MPTVLSHNAYGKSHIRLTKVQRHADRHDLFEWSIDVQLNGDFAAAYTTGDNRQVIATDTMKNIVYALAADNTLSSPEAFALILGQHFLDSYRQVEATTVSVRVDSWRRIDAHGSPHPHAFMGGGMETRTCRVEQIRGRRQVVAGIADLMLLKTADSAFHDFHRDEYRTLPDTNGRIFATSLTTEWHYAADHGLGCRLCFDPAGAVGDVRGSQEPGRPAYVECDGRGALTACSAIEKITLTMPNRHRLP